MENSELMLNNAVNIGWIWEYRTLNKIDWKTSVLLIATKSDKKTQDKEPKILPEMFLKVRAHRKQALCHKYSKRRDKNDSV